MRFRLIFTVLIMTFYIQSCEDSNEMNDNITISISDFKVNIDENPISNLSIGTIQATTNQGKINFSISEQTPNQSIEINTNTGEITVLNKNLFDYETNPIITGIVRTENLGISKTANITINLNDVNEIVDDYKLLAVSNLGEVFKIGNNTGNIEGIGKIAKESDGTFLNTNSLVDSQDKIYAIEYLYNPLPTNNLLIYDKQNGTGQINPLTLPSTINGDERGIIALTLNKNNLIGILDENILTKNSTKHLININLQNNSITELGPTFKENAITSMIKINSKVYISTWGEGFLEVDLTNNTVNKFNSINTSRIAKITDTELGIMHASLW